MHDLSLLVNIAIALVVAFAGGLIARRVGLPTIVGYMLAGILIGPFTPGFVGDIDTIKQLAELGVVFLMFGVGIHFSLGDLWQVRDIAIPGALGRMLLITLLGFGLTQLWGWSVSAGLVFGLAISVASTVVLLRGLMDNSLLNTPHGKAAVGWLVMEDLATVLILLFLPVLAPTEGGLDWASLGGTLLKAAIFVVLMFLVGNQLIPRLLRVIVHTRSRELFILAILAITLGTALAASELFGVSLALGAFVAGVVVSESPQSHQAAADVLPFREAFAILFFVSVGMLVNPTFLIVHIDQVILLTLLIILGKALLTLLLGALIARPARTALVVAAGSSQIGEFSFILGSAGLTLGLLTADQYALILAGALFTITLNPLLFRGIDPCERGLQRLPRLWRLLDRHAPILPPISPSLTDHIVVVGYGRVGHHIVEVAEQLQIPHLVVESSVERVETLNRSGKATLYGEAANSEVLNHAHLDRARALVVTLPDQADIELVVAAGHELAPDLPIISRAATRDGVKRLLQLGARSVIHPELEGGLEIVRHTLLQLGFGPHQVNQYADTVRQESYDLLTITDDEQRILRDLVNAVGNIEVTWQQLSADSVLIGQTLSEANLRARTGASVIAIERQGHVIANPKSLTVFEVGDRIGLIGEPEQIQAVTALLQERDG